MQNRDEINEKNKIYKEQHRDEIIEKQKQYNEQHRDEIHEKQKIYRETLKKNKPIQTKFKRMIENSKRYDKQNNLTIDEDTYINMEFLTELWIQQNGTCFYQDCGVELDYETFDNKQRNPKLLTIQRHDNDISHDKSNVCFACWNCNVNKHREREQYNQLLKASESLTLQ